MYLLVVHLYYSVLHTTTIIDEFLKKYEIFSKKYERSIKI